MRDKCILCSGKQITTLETIQYKDLIKLYKRQFKTDVSQYLSHSDIKLQQCQTCSLKFYSPSVTADSSFYESFEKFPWYYQSNKEEFHIAAEYIQAEDRVLDIGAGTGAFSHFVNPKLYTGLELEERKTGVDTLDTLIINETIQEHAEQRSEFYDVVCMFQVLEHVDNLTTFLDAAVIALRKKGLLIVAVPNEDSFISEAINSALSLPPHHVTRWNRKSLEYLGEMYALDVVEVHYEKLAELHKSWYISIALNSILREKIGLKFKTVDNSFLSRTLLAISSVLGILAKSMLRREQLPKGHSIIACYKKNESTFHKHI